MKSDTKIYSEFIKRNKIVSSSLKQYSGTFAFYYLGKLKVIEITKCDETGVYRIDNDEENYQTKKSAIYCHCKNNFPELK